MLPDKATIWVAGADETAFGTPFWKVGVHDTPPPPLVPSDSTSLVSLCQLVGGRLLVPMRCVRKGCGRVCRCATGEVTVRQKEVLKWEGVAADKIPVVMRKADRMALATALCLRTLRTTLLPSLVMFFVVVAGCVWFQHVSCCC